MTIVAIGMAFILLIIIVCILCLYLSLRRKLYSRHTHEPYFQQQQNQLETSEDRQYKKPSHGKISNRRLDSSSSNDKRGNEKKNSSPRCTKRADSMSTSTNKLPTINEYVPDKLYISDPNDKFSKC
jgi:hypothetical protein